MQSTIVDIEYNLGVVEQPDHHCGHDLVFAARQAMASEAVFVIVRILVGR